MVKEVKAVLLASSVKRQFARFDERGLRFARVVLGFELTVCPSPVCVRMKKKIRRGFRRGLEKTSF